MGANKAVVEQAYGAFAKGDIASLLALVADDVEWSAPKTLPQGGVFRDRGGVAKFFEGVGAAWESLGVEVEALDEVGGDNVVGIVRGEGSLEGGVHSGYGAVHVFGIRDGRIARFREYVDLDGPLV